MMILALVALGVFLSAFFSGSETGFYRVTRVRLVMDAKSGKTIARFLLWLVARPTVVVATVLIGNNIANYLVSFGLVLASQSLFAGWGESFETFLPVLATPLLFIYGELLPKYLYHNAPYYLSTRGAPFLVFCTVLFLPISVLVIGLETLWQRLVGAPNMQSKFSLERQELQRVMMESQEAGILRPVQQDLAQNLFTYGVRPIRQFTIPLRGIPVVTADDGSDQILRLAKRFRQKHVGLLDESGKKLAGCYLVADMMVAARVHPKPLPVCEVRPAESSIHVLSRLQSQASPMAQVIDARGVLIGVVSRDRLISLLLTQE